MAEDRQSLGQVGFSFFLHDHILIEGDGFCLMDCVVPSQKDVFIAPVGYPYDILTQDGRLSLPLEDADEFVDPQQVLMDECDPEKAEVSEEGEGLDVIFGEIEFDEVEALGEGADFEGEGSVEDEQLEGLVIGDELL